METTALAALIWMKDQGKRTHGEMMAFRLQKIVMDKHLTCIQYSILSNSMIQCHRFIDSWEQLQGKHCNLTWAKVFWGLTQNFPASALAGRNLLDHLNGECELCWPVFDKMLLNASELIETILRTPTKLMHPLSHLSFFRWIACSHCEIRACCIIVARMLPQKHEQFIQTFPDFFVDDLRSTNPEHPNVEDGLGDGDLLGSSWGKPHGFSPSAPSHPVHQQPLSSHPLLNLSPCEGFFATFQADLIGRGWPFSQIHDV